jgi:hypothetical protein
MYDASSHEAVYGEFEAAANRNPKSPYTPTTFHLLEWVEGKETRSIFSAGCSFE